MAVDRAGRLWISADDQLLLSEDGGEKWRSVETGDDNLFFCKLLPVNGSLWALGQLGLMTQGASGTDWTRLATLVPAGAEMPGVDANVEAVK